jgi:hypothetical protein
MIDAKLKSKVDTLLEKLPIDGQEELDEFLDRLAEKYAVKQKRNIIALGGIWKAMPLNITDEEIRRLRSEVSQQLMSDLENGLSS